MIEGNNFKHSIFSISNKIEKNLKKGLTLMQKYNIIYL